MKIRFYVIREENRYAVITDLEFVELGIDAEITEVFNTERSAQEFACTANDELEMAQLYGVRR